MKKPLFDRLTDAFGANAINRAISRMLSTWNHNDPLHHLTDDAKQELFERLLAEHHQIRRTNARNRKIYRERTGA